MADPGVNGLDNQADQKISYALLVDGYIRDLFTTGMILQRFDHEVYIVSTAEDALRMIDAAEPALVITELSLPKMSGLELLVRIKQDRKLKAIPVIIHSSSEEQNREQLCRASGCAAFLKKPISPDALYRAIQRATEVTPRQYIRLRTLLPARVSGSSPSGDAMSTEYVSELSENGFFLRTLNSRPLNTVLSITMMIHSIPIKVKAAVLRSVSMNAGLLKVPGMGMKFVEISATDREVIKNFIMGQILKNIPTQ